MCHSIRQGISLLCLLCAEPIHSFSHLSKSSSFVQEDRSTFDIGKMLG